MIKINDRVKVNYGDSDFEPIDIGLVGVVLLVLGRAVLVKFDGFTEGHNGETYYNAKGLPFDKDDRSHWWVYINHLIKVDQISSQ